MINVLKDLGDILPAGSVQLFDKHRDYRRIRQSPEGERALYSHGFTPSLSSVISGVGKKGGDLYIRFHSRTVYRYLGASELMEKMLMSNSKGRFFNRKIKDRYAFDKLGTITLPDDIEKSTGKLKDRPTDKQILEKLSKQWLIDMARTLSFLKEYSEIKTGKFNGSPILEITTPRGKIYIPYSN